ncbi:MAG: Fe-S-containing hydro-lyase [Candidatus Zixiibacteriota bacterium]
MAVKLTIPIEDPEVVKNLKAGEEVLLTGKMYTARDAAHKRLIDLLDKGESLPIDLNGACVYYVGPSPARPGNVIGSAGPTTSGRVDPYTPTLLARGLKLMIGKGKRNDAVKDAIKQYGAAYLAATGGAAALLADRIKGAKVVAYEDLGPEAIRELEVEDFPAVVVNDASGGDAYVEGAKKFNRE